MKTRMLLAGALIAGTMITTAGAADLAGRKLAPVAPTMAAYSWNGFYVGVNAGYAWTQNSTHYSYQLGDNPGPDDIAEFNAAGLVPQGFGGNRGGFIGGGQVGYNYQTGALVLGLEADFQYLDVKRRSSQTTSFADGADSTTIVTAAESGVDWLGTVRARAGVAFDRTLIYATGGLAYGRLSNRTSITAAGMVDNVAYAGAWRGSKGDTRVGWTIGAGAEYALTQNITLKAEYLYYDLGRASYAISGGSSDPTEGFLGGTARHKETGSIARAGLNWKFTTY
jgi:outer membrane immunogenic protein